MNIKVQSFKHLLFLWVLKRKWPCTLHSELHGRSAQVDILLYYQGEFKDHLPGWKKLPRAKTIAPPPTKAVKLAKEKGFVLDGIALSNIQVCCETINDSPKSRRSATAADKFPVAVSELLSMSTLAGSRPDDKMHFYFFLSRKPEPFKTVRRLQNTVGLLQAN